MADAMMDYPLVVPERCVSIGPVDRGFGATTGKFVLAAYAKKNGLDVIHDTVYEMARHGRGLKGLLERYFK